MGVHKYTCRVESLHVLFSLYIQFKFTSPSSCTTNWSHSFYSRTIVPFNFNHVLTKLYFLVNYSSLWLCKVVIIDLFFIHPFSCIMQKMWNYMHIHYPRVSFIIRQSLKYWNNFLWKYELRCWKLLYLLTQKMKQRFDPYPSNVNCILKTQNWQYLNWKINNDLAFEGFSSS
jgi:hypothetical protein